MEARLTQLLWLSVLALACLFAPPAAADPGRAAAGPGRDGAWAAEVAELPALGLADHTDPAPDLDALRERVRVLAAQLPAAVSVAVVEHGAVVWTAGPGLADRERGIPATPGTLYRVGSLSKSVVALGALALVEDGRLDLETPVRAYLPQLEFDNAWDARAPITVAQLLEHTSGFDEMRFNEMILDDAAAELSLDDVLALNPRSRRARWRPGTRHGYSQPGYSVAARVIEQLVGASFDEHLRGRVFGPLHMQDASFRFDARVGEQLARGYRSWQREPVVHQRLHHRAGGGLYVSARDLGKLVQMLVNRGRVDGRQVFSTASIERMEHGRTLPYAGLAGRDYGLGNYRHAIDGVPVQGHGGWMPGFESVYRYFPELGAGYVLLSNINGADGSFRAIDRELAGYLLRDVERPHAPEVELPREQLLAYEGRYRFANPNMAFLAPFESLQSVRVEVEGNGLRARGMGIDERLIPTGPDTFRAPCDRDSSILFTELDGELVMVHQLALFEKCGRLSAWLLGPGLALAQILILASLLSPILWVPAWLAVGRRRMRGLALWVWPSVGAYALAGMVHVLFATPIELMGSANVRTVAIFVLSWTFGLAAIVSLVFAACRPRVGQPRWQRPSRLLRLYARLASVALVALALHFGTHGFLGLRTWMW